MATASFVIPHLLWISTPKGFQKAWDAVELAKGFVQVKIQEGKLQIMQEGRIRKFRKKVQEITFAGTSGNGRQILYVTERCVLELADENGQPKLQLTEIAPGIRLKEDVLDQMDFEPVLKDVKLMDQRCFRP